MYVAQKYKEYIDTNYSVAEWHFLKNTIVLYIKCSYQCIEYFVK